jgi:indole-3-glycerol phosphate synthase
MRPRTPTVLDGILQSTREELERRKLQTSPQALESQATEIAAASGARRKQGLQAALSQPGMRVIAEFKRRSPSAGSLRANAEVQELVSAYRRGGAAALSVLTEGPNFEGSLGDLRAAREACELPILRKDFIVDRYQLHEALLAGADAVLLIVAALEQHELASLNASARELGLDVLVEVHDRDELRGALNVGAELIGINNRDLRDFSVDVARTTLLMKEVPAGVTIVSESGIATAEQLAALECEGVAAVLVGESLMRSDDPQAALETLTGPHPVQPGAADSQPARI